ncbi:MAG: Uma2 family endonuclease [Bacteroidetes bacterium]|nr:Uma2 family endonuclease [Bacteroidota bacterium]
MDFEVQDQATTEISNYELERNKPMPSFNHGTIQANLIMELAEFRNKFRITSETSLNLDQWPSVPDISMFPKSEMDLWNDEIAVKEPPLCVIEILSPTQSLNDLTSKANGYFQHGVQSCWIVLPSMANIYVYSSPDDYAIFRATETLVDNKLDISFSLSEVFK